jgi:hypothetical protein
MGLTAHRAATAPARPIARRSRPRAPDAMPADVPPLVADMPGGATAAPWPTPTKLLALQRAIGNRAVGRWLAARSPHPHSQPQAGATPQAIQRLVGFEFEVNVPIYEDGDGADNAPREMGPTYDFVTGKGIEEKTLVQDKDYATGGFKVVVDHGPISEAVDDFKTLYKQDDYVGGKIDTSMETGRIEYVTAALNENDPAYVTNYTNQLTAVATSITNLAGQHPETDSFGAGDYMIGVEKKLIPPLEQGEGFPSNDWEAKESAMRTGIHYQTYMQATAGIGLGALSAFVQQGGQDEGRFVATEMHQFIAAQVRARLPGVWQRIATGRRPQGGMSDADVKALEGFVALILQYLVGDCAWQQVAAEQGTEKNVVPFWSKLDLAVLRKNLPQKAQDFLALNNALVFATLRDAHTAATQDIVRQPKRAGPLPAMMIFLTGALVGNTDGFSENTGLGMDPLPHNKTGLPLEFRSLAAHPAPGEIVTAALEVLAKVRQTNQAG